MVAKNTLDTALSEFIAAFVDLRIVADHVTHAEDLRDAHPIDLGKDGL
jgi:hypothetical protein